MGFKSGLLKFVDSFLGPIFCSVLSRSQKEIEYRTLVDLLPQNKRILVIRPGGIGDAIMMLPMLGAIVDKCGEQNIDIICESRNKNVFDMAYPNIRKLVYDKSPFLVFRELCFQKYSVVYDTEQFHNFSAVMTALTKATLRIGYKINTNRRGVYTHLVSYDLDGAEDEQFNRIFLASLSKEQQKSYSFEKKFGILSSKILLHKDFTNTTTKIVLIHIGGSVRHKRWSCENYAKLIDLINKEAHRVILIGGKEDVSFSSQIVSLCSFNVDNLCGKLSLHETASLCKSACLVVGPDSGIVHLACAVGTPTVALFGPSDPAKWGSPSNAGSIVKVDLPCSPCSIFGYTKPCTSCDCMNKITPTQVYSAITHYID